MVEDELLNSYQPAQVLTPTQFLQELYCAKDIEEVVLRNPAFISNELNGLLLTAWDKATISLFLDGRSNLENFVSKDKNPLTTYLQEQVDTRITKPFITYPPYPFNRDHTKVVTLVNKNGELVAYMGGYNFGPEEWVLRHDYMLKITDPITAHILHELARCNDIGEFGNNFGIQTPEGLLLVDTGNSQESIIYNQIVQLISSAPKGSKVTCISPWSPGKQLAKALRNAKQNGSSYTYATNIPPTKLDAYSIYNLPKAASFAVCGIDTVRIKTEIHGKAVIIEYPNGSIVVICTGHCLTGYQNAMQTKETALVTTNPYTTAQMVNWMESVLRDRV